MYIILSRLVWRDGELETAIARHMPPGSTWSDMISGDGQTCATIIDGALPEGVTEAIRKDHDVLDYFYVEDDEAPIGGADTEKMQQSAARHGIPLDAMPETPTGADVAEAVKRRMLLSQIGAEKQFETSERIERSTIERLKHEGFNVDEVDPGDDQPTRVAKAQKRRNPAGG